MISHVSEVLCSLANVWFEQTIYPKRADKKAKTPAIHQNQILFFGVYHGQ